MYEKGNEATLARMRVTACSYNAPVVLDPIEPVVSEATFW